MKYVVLIPDGASDYPLDELGSKTPLEVADMPHLKELVSKSELGLVETIPEGFSPGSDVANLNILGYDPKKYYSGRGPLEAAYHGIEVASKDTVFRCNLITVKNGIIKDYSASHIGTEDAATLIKAVDAELGSKEISFYPGMSYRHLTVFNNRQLAELGTVAPHDVMGQPIESLWPKGDGADFIIDLTKRSTAVLENHPINKERQAKGLNPANMIWLWGSGQKKALPSFKERFGLTGAVISAVDLIKGLGVSAGLEVVNVPGATGYYDTDYEAKAKASLKVLAKDDFVYVHVEAPDEAGHVGNVEEKVRALENFDKRLLRIMLGELDLDNTRIMLLPDHATPIILKTHTRDKVPYLIYPGNSGAQSFDENTAAEVDSKDLKGYELMVYFLQR